MCPSSEFQEKMDVLDLIINILKEHEESLEGLADRLEGMINNLHSLEDKISSLNETLAQFLFSKTANPLIAPSQANVTKPLTLIDCAEWTEFKDRSKKARMVAFQTEDKAFTVSSLSNGVVFKYSEGLPEVRFQVGNELKQFAVEKISFNGPDGLSLIFEKRLKCGLEATVRGSTFNLSEGERLFQLSYHVDSVTAKHWLSKELSVPKENIIEGNII